MTAEQLVWCPVCATADTVAHRDEHVRERASARGWITRRRNARARLDAAVSDVVAAWEAWGDDPRSLTPVAAAIDELDHAYRNRHGYRSKRTRTDAPQAPDPRA